MTDSQRAPFVDFIQRIKALADQGIQPDARALPPGAYGALELIKQTCDDVLADLGEGEPDCAEDCDCKR